MISGSVWRRSLACGRSCIGAFALAAIVALPNLRRCDGGENILGPLLNTIRLPASARSAKGFTTEIQLASENSVGYVPVKITFKSLGALTADRRLTYRFETIPGIQLPPRNGLTIDVPVTVPQGTTTRSFVRYLPKWSAGQAVQASVWEEGRQLPEYAAMFGELTLQRIRNPLFLLSVEQKINWLHVGSHVQIKTMPGAARGFAAELSQQDSPDEPAGNIAEYWPKEQYEHQLLTVGVDELPDDWRAYQRFDALTIDSSGLDSLRSDDPPYRAVRDWVLQGGTLVIRDAQSPQQSLETLDLAWTRDVDAADALRAIMTEINAQTNYREQLARDEIDRRQAELDAFNALNVAPGDDRGVSPALDAALAKIQLPPQSVGSEAQDRLQEIKSQLEIAQRRLDGFAKARAGEYPHAPIYTALQWSRQIWMQPAGAGNVIGILASDQRDEPSYAHWQVVARAIDFRGSAMLRRGVDPMIGDRRFSNWLIPGVAQPPVYTFIGLLTGFVILVGPVAYRKTAKHGRSYLMFGIAPLLALLTTLAMFGYGIVSDGFGTVVRARQLTWVDGKSGDAGERIRATYFAGVRPEAGLRFPGNAEVSGYPEAVGQSWEDQNQLSPATIGAVSIKPDAQLFDASFLPSRRQRQFVVHAPRRNLGWLSLIPDPDGIRAPRIESTLDFTLHEAVVRDRRGSYWQVVNLAGGQSVRCNPLTTEQASKALGRLYTDHRPMSRVRETRARSRRYRSETYDLLVETERQYGASVNVLDGLFEYWLRQHLQTSSEIPRGQFVAIADVSPDAVAAEESELVAGVRYVFGSLR